MSFPDIKYRFHFHTYERMFFSINLPLVKHVSISISAVFMNELMKNICILHHPKYIKILHIQGKYLLRRNKHNTKYIMWVLKRIVPFDFLLHSS